MENGFLWNYWPNIALDFIESKKFQDEDPDTLNVFMFSFMIQFSNLFVAATLEGIVNVCVQVLPILLKNVIKMDTM